MHGVREQLCLGRFCTASCELRLLSFSMNE